jgi:hypothetical protein
MALVHRVATAMAIIGGRATMSAAAIMVAACGARQATGSGTASHAATSLASHPSASAAAATGSVPWPAGSQPGRDKNRHDQPSPSGGICRQAGTETVCEWADHLSGSQLVQAQSAKPAARRP